MTGYVDGLVGVAGRFLDVDRGAEREFETRLADCSTLAFRLAFSVLRHHQDAEDVAQEAFAKAHRAFHSLRDRDRFRAWLARMTWRLAIDRQRLNRRRMRHEVEPVDDSQHPSTSEDYAARERSEALWNAIDALPEKLRIAIVLANMEGHGLADVGAILGIPEGTVKWRLFEARRILKEQLAWLQTTVTR